MPGMKYADQIIAGASAKAKKHLHEAIGTAGVHVAAELNAVDALRRKHGAAVCLACAALEITHRRLVAGGVIEASTAVTAEQVHHEQMRLERRGVAKMGAKAFTLTGLTPAEVAARPRHRFGAQAAATQGCTFRRDDKLFTVHDVHICPGSKTELAVYARNMSRALSHNAYTCTGIRTYVHFCLSSIEPLNNTPKIPPIRQRRPI